MQYFGIQGLNPHALPPSTVFAQGCLPLLPAIWDVGFPFPSFPPFRYTRDEYPGGGETDGDAMGYNKMQDVGMEGLRLRVLPPAFRSLGFDFDLGLCAATATAAVPCDSCCSYCSYRSYPAKRRKGLSEA